MSKLTLEYTLPEDAFDARIAQQAMLMHSFIFDLLGELKRQESEAADKILKWAWAWFNESSFDPYDEGGF